MPWYEVTMLNLIQLTLAQAEVLSLGETIAKMSPTVILGIAVLVLWRKLEAVQEQNDKLHEAWRQSDKEIYKSLGGNVADWPEK